MKTLNLAPNLKLPLDFATEGVAVIGMRGAGKTNTEVRFVEELDRAGIPWVVIEPKGDWHGIRSSADGKSPGLSVPVFGGLYADFPLEPALGARIADLLVDENLSAVLDVSGMSKTGQLPTFLTAFCNRLMERHQKEPHVRTVILEEAHRYIPQTVSGPVARMKEAAASLLLEGRAFGLGCWAATQRPARLHKDVLEECGSVIVHRIGAASTHDKSTIAGWVKHYGLAADIVSSLTSLRAGEAWVLIPERDIVQRVQIDRRTTFDSAATPTTATVRRRLTMADIDKDAIAQSLADVIEKAVADDPKTLRRQIADLQRELAKAQVAPERIEVPVETVIEVMPEWVLPAVTAAIGNLDACRDQLSGVRVQLAELADQVQLEAVEGRVARSNIRPAAPPAARPAPAPVSGNRSDVRPPARPVSGNGDSTLGRAERAILTVLAQHRDGLNRKQLGFLSDYSHKSGNFANALGKLRTAGYINRGDPIMATDEGVVALGDYSPLPTGTALLDYWLAKLPKASREILTVMVEVAPHTMTREELADRTGYSAVSGNFANALGKLRTMAIIDGLTVTTEFMEAIGGT